MMKAGDILLFKAEEDLLSKLIAWGTDSKYSHVAVCVAPKLDVAIEAMTKGGVRARDISQIPQQYDIYRIKEEYSYDLRKTLAYLVKQLNNRYDYRGVLYLGILKLIAKVFKKVKATTNKLQKSKDYFCSELCYEAFNFGGLDIVPDVSSADITSPGDIAKSAVVEKITE
ncbi:MAG: YiiX/YebB-like N1pC/P60 family cysteine hydrolase [Candidatus Omnitrophota bacterium]|nr:YiiX/YebB-like N1pC/P60 family cysteine hydrolase [Candidatus Omnitrophota bacterium]